VHGPQVVIHCMGRVRLAWPRESRALGACITGGAQKSARVARRGEGAKPTRRGHGAVHRADMMDFEERVRRQVGHAASETREANELGAWVGLGRN
jgi:hypothetical protein